MALRSLVRRAGPSSIRFGPALRVSFSSKSNKETDSPSSKASDGRGGKTSSFVDIVNRSNQASDEPEKLRFSSIFKNPVQANLPDPAIVSATDEVSYPVKSQKLAADTAKLEQTVDQGEELVDEFGMEVKHKVMPLPEDKRPEDLEKQRQAISVTVSMKPKTDDIPMPKIIRPELKKRMEPATLTEAIKIVKSNARAKFDETVEAHVRLGVDPRRSDQIVRGAVLLPHGSGKVVRVAVFAEGAAAEEAEAAGADVIGADDLIAKIMESGGKVDFEKCIATPGLMPRLSKVARILGPRGLMPNPKVGTVTMNVGEAVKAAKHGRVDFRADKTGIVHVGLGKVSFGEEALQQNVAAFAGSLLAAKPAGLKKSSRYAGFFTTFTLTSTMGKGVPVTIQSVAVAADHYMKMVEAH